MLLLFKQSLNLFILLFLRGYKGNREVAIDSYCSISADTRQLTNSGRGLPPFLDIWVKRGRRVDKGFVFQRVTNMQLSKHLRSFSIYLDNQTKRNVLSVEINVRFFLKCFPLLFHLQTVQRSKVRLGATRWSLS